jgi:hypothetical protein
VCVFASGSLDSVVTARAGRCGEEAAFHKPELVRVCLSLPRPSLWTRRLDSFRARALGLSFASDTFLALALAGFSSPLAPLRRALFLLFRGRVRVPPLLHGHRSNFCWKWG